ncbi:MAG TPA: hypothetical protein VF846_13230, partial [Thermoanaerobaculia bacterium]
QWRGWGIELNDDDFVRAAAALLTKQALGITDDANLADAIRGRSGKDAPPLAIAMPARPQGNAAALRDIWRSAVDAAGPRFELRLEDAALAAIVAHPDVRASSVFLRDDTPQAKVVLDWPLRIGILPDARAAEAEAIVAGCHWPHLVEVVRLGATNTECELLLMPSGVSAAGAALLQHRHPLHADVVVVLGTPDLRAGNWMPFLQTMRDQANAAGIVVASASRDRRAAWFNELIRHLAHDEPFDVAVFSAAMGIASPLFLASRRLVDVSRISHRVDEVVEQMAAAEAPAESADTVYELGLDRPSTRAITASPSGVEMLRARTRNFDAELHGATGYVEFKRVTLPELRIPMAASRTRAPKRKRQVIATTRADGKKRTTLARDTSYSIDVRIGYPAANETAGPTFRDDLLPERPDGHRLRVVFSPLPQTSDEEIRQPSSRQIWLPRAGESESATFHFHTGKADAFGARIVILFENRVLHTLRYGAKLDQESPIALKEELNLADLAQLDRYDRFEAALVVNDTAGAMGVLAIADEEASYTAPAGLTGEIAKMSELLTSVTEREKLPKTMSDPALLPVLFKLANRGHTLWKTLNLTKNAPRVAEAGRIHVVAAHPGELLPIEFLYTRAAPEKEALCTHAAAALAAGDRKARCGSADVSQELCATEFWAFNRVIEHHPFNDPPTDPSTAALPLFRKALLGVSENVRKQDATKLAKALEKLTGADVTVAKNWTEWKAAIRDEEPSLLVPLPHSEPEHPTTEMPALEIGGDLTSVGWIKPEHVTKPGVTPPIVLLLGCTTTITELPFQNFAEAFKREGAAVVIGTLSIVLGRHAATFAIELLKLLHASAGKGVKFGDVLLDARRRRVAAGDPFALSLIAYGDASITL